MNKTPIQTFDFNDYKRNQIFTKFVPIFFKVRLLVIPMLILLIFFFIAYKEPIWKTLCLSFFIAAALGYFSYELFRFKRVGSVGNHRIGFNFLFISIMQNGVFYFTGGILSPILPFSILFIILTNIIFEKGAWGWCVYGSYVVGFTIMGLGGYFNVVPTITPCFFDYSGNAVFSKPIYFWTFYSCYILFMTNTTLISRNFTRLSGIYFHDLVSTREDVIAGYNDRMHEIETIGSQVAHEIKNPLTAIKGLVQNIDRNLASVNEKDKKRFSVIHEEIDRIETIVNEFSNLTRPIDTLQCKPISIESILQDIVSLYDMRFARAGVRVIIDQPQTPLPLITADKKKIKQVLVNIVENAVDAMSHGGTLTMSTILLTESNRLSIIVCDTGVGVAPELCEKIFEPFFSTKPQGAGLGLTIARSIMRQHHGDLIVRGGIGIGTTVDIRFHILQTPEEKL